MKIKDNIDYYEPRFISETNSFSVELWFKENSNRKTLKDVIYENDRIVLLGNPGIGKTRELEKLFLDLWDLKDDSGLIPFSINLKNFRPNNKFEDLILFHDWRKLSNIIFILDGLDEIAEIHDFISAFEIFIAQNKLLNIKYVLSCRTNIYEKYLVRISHFTSFFLDDLTREQAKNLLFKKYGIDIDEFILEEKHFNYLKTPFFLDLFASYLKDNRTLPYSDAEMWTMYVEETFKKHQEKQIKRVVIDQAKLVKDLKKVAFVNELMQKNFSTADELNEILNESHLNFIDNPFMVEVSNTPKRWNFSHRQVHEYFVAKTLSEKSTKEIIEIVTIPGIRINIIHPSLFNTITFLINLLDKNSVEYLEIIEWIQQNQIELLIKADSDRTHDFKVRVFQHYFNAECINKKLWISTNKTFSVKEIARFGDCEENYDYLIALIKDTDNHFRIVISALNLLTFFTIPIQKVGQLKRDFIELLKDLYVGINIKSQIIECIAVHELCKDDRDYMEEIFTIFRNEDNKELNRALLNLITERDVDDFFWYLKEEFLRENKITKRKDADEVIRGTNWILQELVLMLKVSDNFIDIIKYYFFESARLHAENDYNQQLLNKCLVFDADEEDFLIRLLAALQGNTAYYMNDRLLQEIIVQSKPHSNIKAFTFILQHNQFSTVSYFLASIVNRDTLGIIIERYKTEKIIDDRGVDYFRNVVGNMGNRELAKEFNDIMIESGFKFEEPFLSDQEVSEIKLKFANKGQQDLDLLFNKSLLLTEIEGIYKSTDKFKLSQHDIRNVEAQWYEKNGHWNIIDNSITFLSSLIYAEGGFLSFEDVKSILEDDFVRVKSIRNALQNKRSGNTSALSKEQLDFIVKWTKEVSEQIRFDKILNFEAINRFAILEDYEKLKYVLYFKNKYQIQLDREFLLNSIAFFDVEKSYNEDESFEENLMWNDDKSSFEERIVFNINSGKLILFSLTKHIQYALDNGLTKAYPKIRAYFLDQSFEYNLQSLLKQFVDITKDFNLLKECCTDIESHKCWTAIEILMEYNQFPEFCLMVAKKYLDTEITNGKNYYRSKALGILFQRNDKDAVHIFLSYLDDDLLDSVIENTFSNYCEIEEYSILEKLFRSIYLHDNEKMRFGNISTFINTYISNLSKDDDTYFPTKQALQNLKVKLEEEGSDTGLFHINLLIDTSDNSYINSKSKPLKFNKALQKVHSIIG